MSRYLAALALLLVTGCPPQGDFTPQIHVAPGADRRLCVLARHCPENGAPAAKARVHVMKVGEQLRGPNAIGRPGDIILENEEVAFVIDQLGSSAGFADTGGNIVDAADAKRRVDELGQMFTFFGTFPRQAVYDELASDVLPDGNARVVARGKELYEPDLRTETEYRLGPTDRALLIKTTLENKSSHVIDGLALGDAIQWGGAEKFARGKVPGFRGSFDAPFVGAVGEQVSYVLTSTEGRMSGISGNTWTDTIQADKVSLAPGKSISYERVFIVGPRGDSAGLLTELTMASGEDTSSLTIRLEDTHSKPAKIPAGAKFVMTAPGLSAEIMSLVVPDEADEWTVAIPKGTFDLAFVQGGGRRALGAPKRVTAGSKVALSVTGTTSMRVNCVEDAPLRNLPCVVLVEGLDGTLSPNFGALHRVAGRNRVLVNGVTTLDLGLGKFRVTAFRGTEYEPAVHEVALVENQVTVLAIGLKRVQNTLGYLASDLHQHSMLGADAPISRRDRALSNAAYGVEVAVASEHNVVVDHTDQIAALQLEAVTASVAGNELTSDASRVPWGHANAFPLVPNGNARGGAPVVRERLPVDLFTELRALPSRPIIQVNHPRSGRTGYFDALKLDAKTGKGSAPGYDDRFEALEVWNGPNPDLRDRVLDDFFTLLRAGYVVTPTANTDTHGIFGQEPGFPRTYVRVLDDTLPWTKEKEADWVKGLRERRDVVLTNGPFLRMSVAGVEGAGQLALATNGHVKVSVHVECTEWTRVTDLELRFAKSPSVVRAISLKKDARGAWVADELFDVKLKQDDAFVVLARGKTPLGNLLGPETSDMLPFAMTGATWVDVNRDGVSLGRKR